MKLSLHAIRYTSDEPQATCDEFALFWSFFAGFCPFCACLWLIKHLFSRLLNKAISMALWTKAITCDKAGFKSRFCQEHQAGKNIISVNPVILSNFSSCLCVLVAINPFNQRNLRLINDLRSTKDYVRKNKLFMQNKANFRKSQMNVNKVLTKDYENETLGENGKNEPKTNPNEPKTNPIKANKMQKQTQSNPKRTQFLSAISVADQRQIMLMVFTTLKVLENSIVTIYHLEPTRPLNHRRLP